MLLRLMPICFEAIYTAIPAAANHVIGRFVFSGLFSGLLFCLFKICCAESVYDRHSVTVNYLVKIALRFHDLVVCTTKYVIISENVNRSMKIIQKKPPDCAEGLLNMGKMSLFYGT